MNQKVMFTLGAIVLATGSAFATQSQMPNSNPMPPSGGRGGAAEAPVTVAGCVERTGSGATATFRLTKVERAGSSATMSSTPSGEARSGGGADRPNPATQPQPAGQAAPTQGSAMRGGMSVDLPTEFGLMPGPTVDLNAHVSHKVEVTGTYDRRLVSGRSGGPSSSSTNAPMTGSGSAGSAQSGPTKAPAEGPGNTNAANQSPLFSVTAVKMIAATCN